MSEGSWLDLVNRAVPAKQSLLLRYLPILNKVCPELSLDSDQLARCSIQEGAILRPAVEVGGVRIVVCDESTAMSTGTYKDLDACLTVAMARSQQQDRLVLSSGGNLGTALAIYAARAGIEAFAFQPQTTLQKLCAKSYANPCIHLVAVDLPEPDIKHLAQTFAQVHGIIQVPKTEWRFAASATRALFLLEHLLSQGADFDYLTQTICAGYGPVGIYQCFTQLMSLGLLENPRIPRFWGYQQDANAPIVKAWQSGSATLEKHHVAPQPEHYLEAGLYNTNPAGNYPQLASVLEVYCGRMSTINSRDYQHYVTRVLSLLNQAGIGVALTERGEPVEKAGILTGVGILKAIDQGQLRPGQAVAYLLTGGTRRDRQDAGRVEPALQVDSRHSIATWVKVLGDLFRLEPS